MAAKEAWFGFGVDPINYSVIVIAVAQTKEEAEAKCRSRLESDPMGTDVAVWRVFNMLTSSGGRDFRAWLRACRLPEWEIKHVLESLWQSLEEKKIGPLASASALKE